MELEEPLFSGYYTILRNQNEFDNFDNYDNNNLNLLLIKRIILRRLNRTPYLLT